MLVLEPCPSYSPEVCRPAMARLLKAAGGLDWVCPGMTVGVKINLVAALKPDSAATTLAFSSRLKYAFLDNRLAYIQFLQGLSGSVEQNGRREAALPSGPREAA